MRPTTVFLASLTFLSACLLLSHTCPAADQPQWGQRETRNMISAERGLPSSFDPATGENVKWVADLGTESYASPSGRATPSTRATAAS
jgi:hypothetical protein